MFKGLAKKSKSTRGWFFGFKLHIIINDKGELMTFKVTKGNVDDRRPVPDMVKGRQVFVLIPCNQKNHPYVVRWRIYWSRYSAYP